MKKEINKTLDVSKFKRDNIRGTHSSEKSKFDLDVAIKRTAKLVDENQRKRQSLLYPSWSNLDAGKLEIYKTNKSAWVKLKIINKDYPGIYIGKIDNIIKTLTEIKDKWADSNKN